MTWFGWLLVNLYAFVIVASATKRNAGERVAILLINGALLAGMLVVGTGHV